jgi:hypothetical protein
MSGIENGKREIKERILLRLATRISNVERL